jgi:hypothetical protein
MEIWFRTNEFEEALLSLEKVADTSEHSAKNISEWRWLVIALHNALQGLMVPSRCRGAIISQFSPQNVPLSGWTHIYSLRIKSGGWLVLLHYVPPSFEAAR